ncbi:hypothetical protein Dimus_005427 [Dionaea muscipula]
MTAVRGLLLILDPKPHTRRKFFKFFEITRKVWLEAIGGPKRGGKIYPFGNQGGALGLVPKGSSGVPSSFMHSQMAESFERMVLQLEEANTMNNWLKEQLTASAQHERKDA